MEEIGHILREAREAKGLTLAEVQAETRINRRFLAALEDGEFAVLPTPVHARGFLRNYARFLTLDPAPLLDRFELHKFAQPAPTSQVETSVPLSDRPLEVAGEQPFFDPVNFELNSGQRRDSASLVRVLIIVALLVFLGLVANRFIPLLLGNGDGTEALSASVSEVWQNITSGGEAVVEPSADAEPAVAEAEDAEVIQNTSRNDFSNDAETPLPTPFPTRPALPATLDVIDLRLDVSERTWMEVTIDGDVRFSGWAKRGDVFEWTAEEEVALLTGNAYGIFATINETELGRLGEFQEVREELWRTTQ